MFSNVTDDELMFLSILMPPFKVRLRCLLYRGFESCTFPFLGTFVACFVSVSGIFVECYFCVVIFVKSSGVFKLFSLGLQIVMVDLSA